MDSNIQEVLQRELDRLDDASLPNEDFGVIQGTIVGRTGMFYEQDDELYIWDVPIMASWGDCE